MSKTSTVNILFVDDEQNVLDSIKRIFSRRCKDWHLFFSTSGNEALDIIKNNDIDILVSDIIMPKMQGDVLIKRVLESYPHIIRIVLSAHSDQEAVTRALSISHQFVSKPFDVNDFIKTLNNVITLRNEISNYQVIEKITAIDALPVMPDNYKRLMSKLNDPESSLADIAKLISNDFSLSTKILQLINSAYFSMARKILSINEAVNYLGFDVVRSICVTSQLFDNYKDNQIQNFDQEQLLSQSLKIGNLCKTIVNHHSENIQLAINSQLAGFIHSIGIVILADIYPTEYENVIFHYLKKEKTLDQLEFEAFNASHAVVGAYLLQLWSIPVSIITACAYVNRPMEHLQKYNYFEFSPLTALHIAKAINCQKNPKAYFSDYYFDECYLKEIGMETDLDYYIDLTKNKN